MFRKVTSPTALLTFYALALAFIQHGIGLRTDEAKYLLNIPYPHPPVFRFLLSTTLSLPHQDLFWRILLSLALVHAVWFLWDLSVILQKDRRIALAAAWLFSAPIFLQAGTIMTVVPTALCGLLFLWLTLDQREFRPLHASLLGLLWLLALFLSYQSILFAPVLFSLLRRTGASRRSTWFFFLLPIGLLGLYSLTHPLALATILKVGSQDSALPLLTRFTNILSVILLSGGLLTVLGLLGLWMSVRWDLRFTGALVLGYIVLTAQEYYALLLLPLLTVGIFHLFCRRLISVPVFLAGHLLSTLLLVWWHFPSFLPSQSVRSFGFLASQEIHGPILIDGPFGHEWQYQGTYPILRYSQHLSVLAEDAAAVIICTKETCENEIDHEKWKRLPGAPLEMWERR